MKGENEPRMSLHGELVLTCRCVLIVPKEDSSGINEQVTAMSLGYAEPVQDVLDIVAPTLILEEAKHRDWRDFLDEAHGGPNLFQYNKLRKR